MSTASLVAQQLKVGLDCALSFPKVSAWMNERMALRSFSRSSDAELSSRKLSLLLASLRKGIAYSIFLLWSRARGFYLAEVFSLFLFTVFWVAASPRHRIEQSDAGRRRFPSSRRIPWLFVKPCGRPRTSKLGRLTTLGGFNAIQTRNKSSHNQSSALWLRAAREKVILQAFREQAPMGFFGSIAFNSVELAIMRWPTEGKTLSINWVRVIYVYGMEIELSKNVLTEKDLDVEEKKVFGRIIDMWSLGSEEDPYAQSTESEVIKYSKTDGLSEEQILNVLKNLEEYKLIHMDEVDGKAYIKYNADAVHIVKELQKTAYVHSRKKFIPHHH